MESFPNRRVPDLDLGEAAAILLAEQQRTPTVLLMDDAKGRREAAIRKIPSIGTLGILRSASIKGFVRLEEVFNRLRQTNFYAPEEIFRSLIHEELSRVRQQE